MPTVTLANRKTYAATADQTLLAAARHAGLALEYSCESGRCGVCRTRVLSGETKALQSETALSPAEQVAGWQLTCCRAAMSDVHLDITDLGAMAQIRVQTLPCRIDQLMRLSSSVLQVVLRLPPASQLEFLPGQHLSVIGPNGVQRSYSLANAPRVDRKLVLHIRQVSGGQLSQYWFGEAKENDLLRLRGPLGTFSWRDATREHVIFLATGTGMAPIRALLEQLAVTPALLQGRQLHLYWGGRRPEDLYLAQPLPENLGVAWQPVLSRWQPGDAARAGHVQQVVLQDGIPLAQSTVYACGSEAMVQSAQAQLMAAGLAAHQYHADAFVSA